MYKQATEHFLIFDTSKGRIFEYLKFTYAILSSSIKMLKSDGILNRNTALSEVQAFQTIFYLSCSIINNAVVKDIF